MTDSPDPSPVARRVRAEAGLKTAAYGYGWAIAYLDAYNDGPEKKKYSDEKRQKKDAFYVARHEASLAGLGNIDGIAAAEKARGSKEAKEAIEKSKGQEGVGRQ